MGYVIKDTPQEAFDHGHSFGFRALDKERTDLHKREQVDARFWKEFWQGYKLGRANRTRVRMVSLSDFWRETFPERAYSEWISADRRYKARYWWYEHKFEIRRVKV